MANNKHLTLSDRLMIESLLDKGKNFKAIALALDKDPSTISREVKSHMSKEAIGGYRRKFNACANRVGCTRSGLCHPCHASRNYKFCKSCGMCNTFCNDFVPVNCNRLQKPPYVCNGCDYRTECTLKKHFYHADRSHDAYRLVLSESRSGISFSEEELRHFDQIISPLILKGQSPHHIAVTNRDSLMLSERSIYRLIDAGLISAKNIDLPRKVRFRVRKKKKILKVDRFNDIDSRIGRESFQKIFRILLTDNGSEFSNPSAIELDDLK